MLDRLVDSLYGCIVGLRSRARLCEICLATFAEMMACPRMFSAREVAVRVLAVAMRQNLWFVGHDRYEACEMCISLQKTKPITATGSASTVLIRAASSSFRFWSSRYTMMA